KQFARALAILREQHAVLAGADDEVMILLFTFVEVIIDVCGAVTDFDPEQIWTGRRQPQAARSLLPERGFQFLGGENPPPRNMRLELLRTRRSHMRLLIGQAQNLHRRAARRSRLWFGGPADRQGRMQVKADLRVLARSHRTKSDDLSGL